MTRPLVEGTVPSQWYLDMKAERDALRAAADLLVQRSAIDLGGGLNVTREDWLALRRLTERPERGRTARR